MSKIFLLLLLICACVQYQTAEVIGKQYTGMYEIYTDSGNFCTDRITFDTIQIGDTVSFVVPPHYSHIGKRSNRASLAERGLIPPL